MYFETGVRQAAADRSVRSQTEDPASGNLDDSYSRFLLCLGG